MSFLKKSRNFNTMSAVMSWHICYRFPDGDVHRWSINYKIPVERQTFSSPLELVRHIETLSDEDVNDNGDHQNALYAVNVYTVILEIMLKDRHSSVEIWGE
mgnify:CR=1 FL=1